MMRLLTVLIVFLVFSLSNVVVGQVNVGFLGGVNIANLSGEDEDGTELDFNSRTGIGIGGMVDVVLNENLSLVFQPMYLQKGATQTEAGMDFTWKSNYIEVPVLLRITLGSGSTRPYLMGGANVGFLMSSDLEVEIGAFSAGFDAKDLMESTDFGVAIGGGVLFQLENLNIFVDGRYNLGLKDIFKGGEISFEGETEEIPNAEVKTNGIQIMGGIIIPLGSQ